ncbi:MAG: pentapeptide repeat-containing protein [Cyanobacteria bacterium P01_H01_bin.105]
MGYHDCPCLVGMLFFCNSLIAVITYIGSEKQRRDTEVFTAWQTITNAQGQPGSGGRIKALEFLNASPRNNEYGYSGANWRRRAICLWICVWESESLEGIDLSTKTVHTSEADLQEPPPDGTMLNNDTRRVFLRGIHLPDASLVAANLTDTNLDGANLTAAVLVATNLTAANLASAKLAKADLTSANLTAANLISANLISANLTAANLASANLWVADLASANLKFANLAGADLKSADFTDANLDSTNLEGADLGVEKLSLFQGRNNCQGAKLLSTNLSHSNLSSAILECARLENAILNDAILLATDLRTTKGLTQEQLEGEHPPFICNTPLPEHIEIQGDHDRDCDKLAAILYRRYPGRFESPEKAENFVREQQQKTWD